MKKITRILIFVLLLLSAPSLNVKAVTGISPSELTFRFHNDSSLTKKIFVQNFSRKPTTYTAELSDNQEFVEIIQEQITVKPNDTGEFTVRIAKPVNFNGEIRISSEENNSNSLDIQTAVTLKITAVDQKHVKIIPGIVLLFVSIFIIYKLIYRAK